MNTSFFSVLLEELEKSILADSFNMQSEILVTSSPAIIAAFQTLESFKISDNPYPINEDDPNYFYPIIGTIGQFILSRDNISLKNYMAYLKQDGTRRIIFVDWNFDIMNPTDPKFTYQ